MRKTASPAALEAGMGAEAEALHPAQRLCAELAEVERFMERCLLKTAQDFAGARRRARAPDEEAWTAAQSALHRSKTTLQALLRRQRNTLALFAAEYGKSGSSRGSPARLSVSCSITPR